MITHKCRNCIWWDNREQFTKFLPQIPDKPNAGFCRRRKAVSVSWEKIVLGIHPIHDAEEFCGEFKGES